MRALEAGLHVMLFSDNVPLEQEIALKHFAREERAAGHGPGLRHRHHQWRPAGLCQCRQPGQTSASSPRQAPGLQEVSCIISNAGAGISQAIGTGGRDVKQEVGGIMFIEALKALAKDEADPRYPAGLQTAAPAGARAHRAGDEGDPQASCHVVHRRRGRPGNRQRSKRRRCSRGAGAGPGNLMPSPAVRCTRSRLAQARTSAKPPAEREARNTCAAFSAAAPSALRHRSFSRACCRLVFQCARARREAAPGLAGQPGAYADRLGEDEFTVGRPHPMIDYSLRNRRILEEAADPETAVILLDVVLGYGANPDPAAELGSVSAKPRGRPRSCAASPAPTRIHRTGAEWRRRCASRAQS